MVFPYVPNYGGDWKNYPDVTTPISQAKLDNLETQFASVLALLTTQGDTIHRGAATWERLAKGTLGDVLRQGAAVPAWGSIATKVDTEVFNGNSPNPSAWTNLDISAVVGTRAAFVYLRVHDGGAGGNANMHFRPNGETEYTTTDVVYNTMGSVTFTASNFSLVATMTAADGIVEWYFSAANQANTTIDVIGYI